ncbi:MAG: hypothetical protein R2729_20165 [Bryobacteraceae bacterium]
MRSVRTVVVGLALSFSVWPQAVDVGTGPVSELIRQEFVRAYFRNGFQTLVSLPPLGNVRRLGSSGLVQEFADAAGNETNKYALVRGSTSDTVTEGSNSVLQVFPRVYSAYTSIGPNTAGYPTTDTNNCPVFGGRACTFQIFSANYAIFAYAQSTLDGAAVSAKDPFFTKWRSTGGIGGLGPATAAEETVTSGAGTSVTATLQRFAAGIVFNITSGTLEGRIVAVQQPILDLYNSSSGEKGFLGLPTADESRQPDGKRRQVFEGGVIEYEPGGAPVLRLPVASVTIRSSDVVQRVNLGDTFRLEAQTFAATGASLDGRVITWSTSNARVLAIQPAGATATIRAVGGGAATITAISEGKTSRGITYFVNAPCCQIGEGSPNAQAEQAFLDAVTRNRLNVQAPAPAPVRRVGNGLVQETTSASDPNVRYLLAKPDSQARAFVVTGPLLARYIELGGPAGSLGYPISDPTAQGRQIFENGALGGDPAQLVSGGVLTRWAAQNYETGPAGLPTAAAREVLSFQATLGDVQRFTGGSIVAHRTGSNNGKAFLVSGLILAAYDSAGGPGGKYGLPAGEEFSISGLRRQEFEGAVIEYAPGASAAEAREADRRPRISATPGSVSAGARVRIAAGGFPAGATLRIKAGAQPDFVVSTETGAFAWEIYVPANTPSGVVQLRAAHVEGTAIAAGSYIVTATSETLAQVTKIRGDLQTGLPGARLAQPFRIAVKDENGVPLAGVAVRFNPSPGAQIEQAQTVTDERGEAQAYLRLPLAELPALATAEAGRQVVTFSARAQAKTLLDYPRFTQAGTTGDAKLGNETATIAQRGALLVATASMVRYLQDRGLLGMPNGPADPLLLNTFLKDLCLFDSEGAQVCDGFFAPPGAAEVNLNPWRLASFVNGALDLVPVNPSAEAVRDALAQDVPVLLALEMRSGETLAGSHFLVAIGVAADGGIVVHDPNPALSRSVLADYLSGLSLNGRPLQATLAGAIRLAGGAPSALGFLVSSTEPAASEAANPAAVSAPSGPCGFTAAWPDIALSAAGPTASVSQRVRFSYCDGQQPAYQLDFASESQFLVSDLGTVAGRFESRARPPAAFRLTRPASNWTVSPLTLDFQASTAVNSASFAPALAPGSLATIFGSGLSAAGAGAEAFLDGSAATVFSATAFQLNLVLPADAPPGQHRLTIRSPYGERTADIMISATAPGIFELGAGRGAILNQTGSINSVGNPALRGQALVVYATGLGSLRPQGNLQVVAEPVVVNLGGRRVSTTFAGAAPGFPGLNQINLIVPEDLPPGLAVRMVLEQGQAQSNAVLVAIQ